MADQRGGGITATVDRGGRRTRHYKRLTPGPGKAERKRMASGGLGWCRECESWLVDVRLGLCRQHRNADYRRRYRGELGARIRARVASRRWADLDLPTEAAEMISEVFGGRCAYCPEPAATWDHLIPVSRGGRTEPGNIVPACKSCNSRKRARDPLEFIDSLSVERINPMLWDRIALAAMVGILDG